MKTNEPIETDDPAYQQMMRSFQQIPNIDIHVGSEREQEKDNETEQKPTHVRHRKTTAKKTVTRKNANASTKRDTNTVLVVSPETKQKLMLAKLIYEATSETHLSMNDFISALLNKGYKKLNPTASNILDTTFAKLQETGTDED